MSGAYVPTARPSVIGFTSRSMNSGAHDMSPPRNTRIWPLACSAATFRALAGPRWGRRSTVAPPRPALAAVSSREPSSATITSRGGSVCSLREESRRPMWSASLYAATITLTAGSRLFPIGRATLQSAAIREDSPPAKGAVEHLGRIAIRTGSARVGGQAAALTSGSDVLGQHVEAHPELTARLP